MSQQTIIFLSNEERDALIQILSQFLNEPASKYEENYCERCGSPTNLEDRAQAMISLLRGKREYA